MKARIDIAIAFAITGIALAGCPRDQTPTHEDATPAEPATAASLVPPASTTTPQANEPAPPQRGHARAPTPEPDPLIPPPPPPPVEK